MRWLILSLLSFRIVSGQTIEDCKQRFNQYLNFKGSISPYVVFTDNHITINDEKGRSEFRIHKKELPMLAEYFKIESDKNLEKFYKQKGVGKLSKKKRDSLWINIESKLTKNSGNNLKGLKIAIDAGHIASSFNEAQTEQKFLWFPKDSLNPADSVKLFEGQLTHQTALYLKSMIEKDGGEVFLTRGDKGLSSFGMNYQTWFETRKSFVLDSLRTNNRINGKEYSRLSKLEAYPFFWEFFRNYELEHRSELINNYKPDLTVVIHYNVDEKNEPWLKFSDKNYTMCFIGGCYTASRLQEQKNRVHLVKLMITNILDESEKLSSLVVANTHAMLGVQIAKHDDATYLKNNCMPTKNEGVYCRQLLLCNTINSPLVYGESLYQDNLNEAIALTSQNSDNRLKLVAEAYYKGIVEFFQTKNAR
ncbi:MAG: N-acetylmuramoyl-L-alanine amidase [Bacteroidia bacterium]